MTRLSALLNYQVLDGDNHSLGTASEFVLNLCEAHLLYMVVDVDPALNLPGGNRLLIPYEVASLGNGVTDVDQQAIRLEVDRAALSSAPAFSDTLDLAEVSWEADLRAYWADQATLSRLSTACEVPAPGAETAYPGPNDQATASPAAGTMMLTRIAYASQVLGMQLQDGDGRPVGQVEEVIVEPESGWLRFLLVRLDQPDQAGQAYAAVPLRAVNLGTTNGQEAALLVLVVDREVLDNAPGLPAVPDPSDDSWESPAMEYWGQQIPLVDSLPYP